MRWSRPGFADSFKDIPDRTQVALFRYSDRCGCLVPMVGNRFKSYLTGGTEDEICLVMTALRGGLESLDEILKPLACSDGKLLMMARSARPTEDCVFTDPVKEGVLKLSRLLYT
ncbi:MAG: hypothetical protein J6D57_07945 [Mogibacterium sp.]|nr:hypothetical protein [Mogibacterium sp.]